MKPALHKKISSSVIALGIGAGMLSVPAISQAEDGISSGMNVSSMYLWRGLDLSNSAPAVSGNVDYSIAGFTLGTWASSEGLSGSYEWDIYASYSMEFGGVGLTLGYIEYMYPEAGDDMSKTDFSEYNVGVSFADFELAYFLNTQSDDSYVSLDYSMDKLGFHVGSASAEADDFSYIDAAVSYSMSDAASVTVSKIMADSPTAANLGTLTGRTADNPMVVFSYDIPL